MTASLEQKEKAWFMSAFKYLCDSLKDYENIDRKTHAFLRTNKDEFKKIFPSSGAEVEGLFKALPELVHIGSVSSRKRTLDSDSLEIFVSKRPRMNTEGEYDGF